MATRWLMVTIISGVLSTIGARGESLVNQAYEASQRGDIPTAFRLYRQAAERGDPLGWHNLGSMFFVENDLVAQDMGVAFRYFSIAARLGYPPSQVTLGHMLEHGKGTPMERIESLKWYLLAAAQGNKAAQEKVESMKPRWTAADWENAVAHKDGFQQKPLHEMPAELRTYRKEVQPWPVTPRSPFSFFYMFNVLDPKDMSEDLTVTYAYSITRGEQVYLVSDVEEIQVTNGQTAILTLEQLRAGRTPGQYTIHLALRCNGRQWIVDHPLLIENRP